MDTLILTAMRDEAPYLLEWVAYHRLIGVTGFLVYSNDCADGTDAMLDRLQEMGLVHHVRNHPVGSKGVQWTALERARDHPALTAADWLLVADVDEFVNIRCGAGRLEDLLAAAPGADAIALTWRLFGSAGRVGVEDAPVIARFDRAAPFPCQSPWEANQFKTLYRNDGSYRRPGVHRPKGRDAGRRAPVWANGSGHALGPEFLDDGSVTMGDMAGDALVCLNHYSVKSAEAFLVKSRRGLPNRAAKAVDIGYWVDRNFNTVQDRSIQRHLPDLAGALAELRADPVLDRLHRAGLEWHRARAREVMAGIEGLQLFARILGAERHDIDPDLARDIVARWPAALRAGKGAGGSK